MASQEISARYQLGDRVRVDGDVQTIPPLPGYLGIVKEVVRNYASNSVGYNLTLENDPRPNRIWFFLQDQLEPA